MEPQAFDRRRRTVLIASAAVAAGAVAVVGSCQKPQGMRRAPGDAASTDRMAGEPKRASEGSDAQKPAPSKAETPKPRPEPVERPAPPSSEPAIRIRTGSLTSEAPSVEIRGPGSNVWIVEPGSGRPGVIAQCPVEFTWTREGWRVREAAKTRDARAVALPPMAVLEISSLRGEPRRLTAFGSEWPGIIRLVPRPAQRTAATPPTTAGTPTAPTTATTATPEFATADVVHELPMEEYLPGVIAKELFNSWGVATHQAQAIAARSWALCEMAMWRTRRHFDTVAGEAGQAWIGATKHRRSADAVNATRGQVLLYSARVVPAYYSSCCGGARAAARDAISSSVIHDIEPLRVERPDAADCCSWSPTYRWQLSLDAQALGRTLPAWARAEGYASLFSLEGIRRIEIAERNRAGRPVAYTITDAKGALHQVLAERLRWGLNADPAAPSGMRPSRERVKSAYFEPLVRGRELFVSGRGHGHGVGMCQYGAEAMAKKGAKASAILARYYPGASIEKSYA
ncbi:MAG: SpoIID/LytB domain-containing protein [Phycisphaera sp.]|nr:SpoIID/LytB domain-containing protein [Phycisphaera sp.]